MSYAGSRTCFDADSHLMPEPDFLTRFADAKLRDALWIGGGKNGGAAFENRFDGMMTKVRDRLADPEGSRDPIGKFEASLDGAGISETARTRFYSENFKDMMGL